MLVGFLFGLLLLILSRSRVLEYGYAITYNTIANKLSLSHGRRARADSLSCTPGLAPGPMLDNKCETTTFTTTPTVGCIPSHIYWLVGQVKRLMF